MDAEFERRWRSKLPPFDGTTVTLTHYVPLPLLRQALISVVQRLYAYRPETALFHVADWHEHDGCVIEAKPCNWQNLTGLLISDVALEAACLSDTYVRSGYFPQERDYYLRIYVPEVGDSPISEKEDAANVHTGIFDVTCQESLAAELADLLRAARIANVATTAAKEYFDENYRG